MWMYFQIKNLVAFMEIVLSAQECAKTEFIVILFTCKPNEKRIITKECIFFSGLYFSTSAINFKISMKLFKVAVYQFAHADN